MMLKSDMYDRKKPNMPRTWRVCFLVAGRGISITAWMHSGSGSCLPNPMMWPMYLTEFPICLELLRFELRRDLDFMSHEFA